MLTAQFFFVFFHVERSARPADRKRAAISEAACGALWRSAAATAAASVSADHPAVRAAARLARRTRARAITESTWHAALVLTPPSWKRPLVTDTPVIDRHVRY